jgi:hypothetical protein
MRNGESRIVVDLAEIAWYSKFGAWSHGLYTRVFLGWLGLKHHTIMVLEVSVDEVRRAAGTIRIFQAGL